MPLNISVGIPNVITGAGTGTGGAIPAMTGAATGGSIGSKILGTIGGILNPIGGIASTIGSIAGMFKGKPKAEKVREDVDQAMRDVMTNWRSGKLDSDSAILTLQNLYNTFDGDPLQKGVLGSFYATLAGEINATRNKEMNAAFKPGEAALTGAGAFQKERGQTLMRNLLMGTQSGKDFGANTVAGKLVAPRADVNQQYATNLAQFGRGPVRPQGADELGSRLQSAITRFGG